MLHGVGVLYGLAVLPGLATAHGGGAQGNSRAEGPVRYSMSTARLSIRDSTDTGGSPDGQSETSADQRLRVEVGHP